MSEDENAYGSEAHILEVLYVIVNKWRDMVELYATKAPAAPAPSSERSAEPRLSAERMHRESLELTDMLEAT